MKVILASIVIIFSLLLFNLPGIVIGSVDTGNLSSSIQASYSQGERVIGWINISFDDESLDSQISAKIDGDSIGSISLKDLIAENSISSSSYNCTPSDCGIDYSKGNSYTQASFTMDDEKLMGFVVNGDQVDILSLTFDVDSDSGVSCNNQLGIDLLNNNETNWENKNSDASSCDTKNYGCYGSYTETVTLVNGHPYCQKIDVKESPKLKVGAWIQKVTTTFEEDLIQMKLFGQEGFLKGSCNLTEPTTTGTEVECDIDYGIKENDDYYICVVATKETDYEMRGETGASTLCGFDAYYPSGVVDTFSMNYNIFAQEYKYGAVGSFTINDTVFKKDNNDQAIDGYIDGLIASRYSLDCTSDCIIPIKFEGLDQLLTVDNIELKYKKTGSASSTVDKIYEISQTDPEISSNGFIKLDLNKANFTLPAFNGSKDLEIYFDGVEIITANITVQETAMINSVYPRDAPAAYPSIFSVSITKASNKSIVEYKWDFGDNSSVETTNESRITHTYSEIGTYTLKITIEDSSGATASKEFSINVIAPKEAANNTIQEIKSRISNLTIQINSFESWYKLDDLVDLNGLDSNLSALEADYLTANNDSEYVSIMNDLIDLRVPYLIKPSKTSALHFFNDKDKISLMKVEEIAGGSYSNAQSDDYKAAIVSWFAQNVNVPIDYNLFAFYYDDGVENVLSTFSLSIEPKTDLGTAYFIIEKPEEDFLFGATYDLSADSSGDSTGIELDLSSTRIVKFGLYEDVEPLELEMYLSPSLDEIDVDESYGCEGDDCDQKPYWIPWTIFFIVIIAAFIIYVFLQEWYKKNYERHLFKNQNELYNLINFIYNAKKQRIEEREMRRRLHRVGWSFEQISYALKKFKGQRTGMFEIPLFRLAEKKKIREEIKKRQAPNRRFANP